MLQENTKRQMSAAQQTVSKKATKNLTGKHKAFVVIYAVIWIVAIGFSWTHWHEMNWIVKTLVVLTEIFLLPDVGAFRSAFRNRPDV